MSERGSYATQYVYGFSKNHADVWHRIIDVFRDHWGSSLALPDSPIITGMARSGYEGGEIVEFECDIAPEIQKILPAGDSLRVAVLSDSGGEAIFLVNKNFIKRCKLDIEKQRDTDVVNL